MTISYENMLLTNLKNKGTNTPYAIMVSGQKECIPDLITLLTSIHNKVDLHLYTIIYFYHNYSQEEIEFIHTLFPETVLVDLDKLSEQHPFLSAFKLLCNGRYGIPVGAKFYSLKLLNIFKAVIFLDRDTIVLKDFTQQLKQLEKAHIDVAAVPCNNELSLLFKKRINANAPLYDEYLQSTGRDSAIKDIQLINSGVVIFYSSIISKLDIDNAFNEIDAFCRFGVSKGYNILTDEEVLYFIKNLYKLKFFSLSKEYNYIVGLSGISYQTDTVKELKELSILHLAGSDKRSPVISCIFPEVDNIVQNVIRKIQTFELNTKYPNTNWILTNLFSNSYILNPENRLKLISSYRNFNFYKECSYSLYKFLETSKYFYTEKILNNEYFMIFLKNIDQPTRLNLRPCFFSLWDIEVHFRIYYEHKETSNKTYINIFNSSQFKEEFMRCFFRSTIFQDNKYLHLKFFIHKNDLIKELNKLETLFNKYEDELYLYLL